MGSPIHSWTESLELRLVFRLHETGRSFELWISGFRKDRPRKTIAKGSSRLGVNSVSLAGIAWTRRCTSYTHFDDNARKEALVAPVACFALFMHGDTKIGIVVYHVERLEVDRPLLAYCTSRSVGAVSNGSLRHEVQTLPLWFPIVLGYRGRELAKWAALPCLVFWLMIMIFIWLFLLGWPSVVSGHFSMTEIAMTMLVGVACIVGLGVSLCVRTPVSWWRAVCLALFCGVTQILASRVSLIPYIATR